MADKKGISSFIRNDFEDIAYLVAIMGKV